MTTIAPPICAGCKHLFNDLRDPRCDAFPGRIPNPILLSRVDHREPYSGDQDIRFEPKTPDAAAYADRLFRPMEDAPDEAPTNGERRSRLGGA